MNNVFYILVLCCVALVNCSTKSIIPFQPRSLEPYFVTNKMVHLKYVCGEENYEKKRRYGVFTAYDSLNDTSFLIVTPRSLGSNGNEYEMNGGIIAYSVVLHEDKAKRLIENIREVIKVWDNEKTYEEGCFLEFYCTPEVKEYDVKEKDKIWVPSLKYRFQNTQKGPLSSLNIGKGIYREVYEFDSLEDNQDFLDLLIKGVEELKKMGN